MTRFFRSSFAFALLVLVATGCSSKSDNPSPTVGNKGANEYDIKVTITSQGLTSQTGPDGLPYQLGASYYSHGKSWAHLRTVGSGNAPEIDLIHPSTTEKGYKFPIQIWFYGIRRTDDPVPLNGNVSITAAVEIDGKVVDTIVLDKNSGYITRDQGNEYKGVEITVDLAKY